MSIPPVEAVLQAGDTETLYRRAGDGPPVLLLCAGSLAEPLGGRLFERLATRFRVVATAVPAGERTADVVATWLGELLEGLGLVRPSLVVDVALAGELFDGGQVDRDAFSAIVGVVAASAGAGAAQDTLAGRGALIVPVPAGEAEAAAIAATVMTTFLVAHGSGRAR